MVLLMCYDIKFSEGLKKGSKYCSTYFNIKVCGTHKHTDLCLVYSLLFISQDVMIIYVNLWSNIKFHKV